MNRLIFRVLVILYTMHTLAECERNSQDLGYRKRELRRFRKKLNESIYIYQFLSENELNPAQVFKNIESHMGNGFEAVVFNCDRPSFLELTIYDRMVDYEVYQEVPLTCQQSLKDLKENAKCNSSTNLWHFEEPFSHATWDLQSKTISKRLIPFDSLFFIFNKLRMCFDFVNLINHPTLFQEKFNYKKPKQCAANYDRTRF
jgi:hypothetical protein